MSRIKPLYVSFYTPDDVYRVCGERLKASFEKFGLDYEVDEIAPMGDYRQIICHKSAFVAKKMQENPGRPIVWIDADSEVVKYPAFFDWLDADIATAKFCGQDILACTIYFANNNASQDLVTRWDAMNRRNTETYTSDQDNLAVLLGQFGHKYRYFELPESYAYVPGETKWVSVPVIKQFVVSRTENGRELYADCRKDYLGVAIQP